MDCKNAKELLSFLVFDEIEESDRGRLEAHLQVCGSCTRNLENYRVVREALSDLPDPEVPGDFLVGVRARLEQPVTWAEHVDEAMSRLTRGNLAAGASLAVVAGFAFLVGQTSGNLTEMPTAAARVRQEADVVALAPVAAEVAPAGAAAPEAKNEQATRAKEDVAGAPAEAAADEVLRQAGEAQRREAEEERVAVAASSSGPPPSAPRSPRAIDPQEISRPRASAPQPLREAPRPGAAESFDDVFGDVAPPAEPEASPTEVAALPRVSAQPPTSPFLEHRDAGAASGRSLSSMGAPELDAELARLEKARKRIRTRSNGAGMSIFSPEDGGAAADADASLGASVADDFEGEALFGGGGSALARVADSDPFDSRGPAPPPARSTLVADAPRLAPVTVAYLRTTFGRGVSVLQATEISRFPSEVRRELSLRSSDPRGALAGIDSLIESGLGVELEGVELRPGEEVTLLLDFGQGSPGQEAMERFVLDLQGISGTVVAADVMSPASARASGLARVTLPTP